jgi:hypothetical protein
MSSSSADQPHTTRAITSAIGVAPVSATIPTTHRKARLIVGTLSTLESGRLAWCGEVKRSRPRAAA